MNSAQTIIFNFRQVAPIIAKLIIVTEDKKGNLCLYSKSKEFGTPVISPSLKQILDNSEDGHFQPLKNKHYSEKYVPELSQPVPSSLDIRPDIKHVHAVIFLTRCIVLPYGTIFKKSFCTVIKFDTNGDQPKLCPIRKIRIIVDKHGVDYYANRKNTYDHVSYINEHTLCEQCIKSCGHFFPEKCSPRAHIKCNVCAQTLGCQAPVKPTGQNN